MSFFASEYTIHFDDTMAYGSHHFLTAFKFQCSARETYLFGDRMFDQPGVPEALDQVHLFTADAYSRNLNPLVLGDRVVILLSLEDWGRVSVRFCYRVISKEGTPICAGFQNMICADAKTGLPIPLPKPIWDAMQSMSEIEEPAANETFRDRVLAGGSKVESLFGRKEILTAKEFLRERYPQPGVIHAVIECEDAVDSSARELASDSISQNAESQVEDAEAWIFAGQGAFDATLLSERITAYKQSGEDALLKKCEQIAVEVFGDRESSLFSGRVEQCQAAVDELQDLMQIAIHLQNVLGAELMRKCGRSPKFLVGHSFGEIAALGVAGCYDLPTGVRIVCERVSGINQHAPADGALLLLLTDRETVAIEASLLRLNKVVVAGRNERFKTVASGPRAALKKLADHFREIGVPSIPISSPTSFHHPDLIKAAGVWGKSLTGLQFDEPDLPVYSPIGRRFVAKKEDVIGTLTTQLVRPFDLAGSIEDLVNYGVTKFVDCGSTGSLAQIVAKTAANALVTVAEYPKIKSESQSFEAKSGGRGTQLEDTATVATVAAETVVAGTATRSEGRASDKDESRKDVSGKDETSIGNCRTKPSVAIVGMGCVLPAGANSPEKLFESILEQRVGIVDQRDFDANWEKDFYSPKLVADRSTSPLSGRVNNGDIVAPEGVDSLVFESFSRAQKLLAIALAPCVPVLRNAKRVTCLIGSTADGFDDQDLSASLKFAGIDPARTDIDERFRTAKASRQKPHDAVQEVFDRVIYPGLKIVLVDAACASSLYTVALGTVALELDETDVVLAGGVFCPGPGNSCLFSQFNGTTATGCRPFDQGADGVVFSEGSAVVALCRKDRAEEWGLPISAIIKGIGLSSDGKSSSANVPQSNGQLLSLQRCYEQYNIDPASIQAIEGHGTSTPVGDATELRTLQKFFEGRVKHPVPVHSLKGLLGHAGWAAGTASIIAVTEYLRRGTFPSQAFHRRPSETLQACDGTLYVPREPVRLPKGDRRIAIDGFGFGGANGHVVLESFTKESNGPASIPQKPDETDELVVVSCDEILPTTENAEFDRQYLPEGHVFLPDLADDMDITQKLAITLADSLITKLPSLTEEDRRQVGISLALAGKSERGIEATARVLASRFERQLDSHDDKARLKQVLGKSRPSGPYTLQCMMPNVASGRAALNLNLNGPNFVVDASQRSLEAAIDLASLLLRSGENSGTKLMIVGAIEANRAIASEEETTREFAVGLVVTTKAFAKERGLTVLSSLDDLVSTLVKQESDSMAAEVLALTNHLVGSPVESSSSDLEPLGEEPLGEETVGEETVGEETVGEETVGEETVGEETEEEFPIHTPVWVERPSQPVSTKQRSSMVIIAPDDSERLEELLAVAADFSRQQLICLVGPEANRIAREFGDARVIPAVFADQASIDSCLAKIGEFRPDVVTALQPITPPFWKTQNSLAKLADSNHVCELLFLVAKDNAERLHQGELELAALLPGGWNGVVHPCSGPFSGMLKALDREIPALRSCVLSTSGNEITDGLRRIEAELSRQQLELEVVYDGDTRMVRRLRPLSLSKSPISRLESNSVVVATGGARGVTAVLLESLLRDYGCKVVVLGRSKPEIAPNGSSEEGEKEFYESYVAANPNGSVVEMRQAYEKMRARWEAHETVQELSRLGYVEYMQADVSKPTDIDRVIDQIASRFGKVDLVLHGAGIQYSKRLEDRSLEEFQKTFAVKVHGLRNLVAACERKFGRIVDVHALTSAYSVLGNDGQHDYGASNETLDRLCDLSSIDGTLQGHDWSSVAWLAWDGIGMTRGSEYKALAKQRGLSGLSRKSGQRIFRKAFQQSESKINVPLAEAEHADYSFRTIPSSGFAFRRILEVPVELSKIECLKFHKVRNTPTLPGAWILDRMVNAGVKLHGDQSQLAIASIENIVFSRFVRFAWEYEPNIRVIAEDSKQGIALWMIGDVLMPNGKPVSRDVLFAQANLKFESNQVELQSKIRRFETPQRRRVKDPYIAGRSEVQLSGPFDCVRDIYIGPEGGRSARFAPNPRYSSSGVIPALLLDSALRVAAMHATPNQEGLCVPVHIGRLVAPVGGFSTVSQNGWEIRTTAPNVNNLDVHSGRTEIFDEFGKLKAVIDDTMARTLH